MSKLLEMLDVEIIDMLKDLSVLRSLCRDGSLADPDVARAIRYINRLRDCMQYMTDGLTVEVKINIDKPD